MQVGMIKKRTKNLFFHLFSLTWLQKFYISDLYMFYLYLRSFLGMTVGEHNQKHH